MRTNKLSIKRHMEIERMREIIEDKLCVYPWEIDVDIETNPANYGLENISISVDTKDVCVKERTFSFNGKLTFTARLMASGRSGYDQEFTNAVSGTGQFEFVKNSTELEISNINIKESLELYEGNPEGK